MKSGKPTDDARALSARSPVRCKRLVHDIDLNSYWLELRFAKAGGGKGKALIPRRDSLRPHDVYGQLLDLGADLPTDPKVAQELIREVVQSQYRRTLRVTGRGGWHNNAFVFQGWTEGGGSSAPRLRIKTTDLSAIYAAGGTTRAWRRGLKTPCRSSSYLRFGLGIGFGASLHSLIGEKEGATFNFHGHSSVGKSLLARACQSISARGGKNDLATYDLSPAARDELCFARNDGVVVVDEQGRLPGSPEQQRKDLRAFAYAVAGGVGRRRSKSVQAALPDLTWVCLGLTTAEDPLEDGNDRQRKGGERLRHIDIPLPDRASGGIFDRLRGENVGLEAAALAKRAEDAITSNYGRALRRFVRWLTQNRDAAASRARRIVDAFVARRGAAADPWEARFACKFGIVLAGMLLAVEAGVAPWNVMQAKGAVARVYRVARGAISVVENDAKLLLVALRDGQADGRFPALRKGAGLPSLSPEGCWGLSRQHKGLGDVVAIDPDQFDRLAGSAARATAALDRLLADGAAIRGSDGKRRYQLHHGALRRRWVLLKRSALN